MTGRGDLNINRPTTRSGGVPQSSVRDNGTAASFLSLKGSDPAETGSCESRFVVGHRESDGRDAWAAVPITLIERSSGSKPVAQASSSKVSVSATISTTLCEVITTPDRKVDRGDHSKSNRDISSQLESLILAQNERWRQA